MIYDVDSARILAHFPVEARTPGMRLRGLIARKFSPRMDAMVFSGCNAVHTFLMGMSIDILFLDREGRAVRVVKNVPPWRPWIGAWQGVTVVEFPAGTLAGVEAGHRIEFRQSGNSGH